MPSKNTKKCEKTIEKTHKKKEEESEKLTYVEILIIIATIVLLIAFLFLLYILYTLLTDIKIKDPMKIALEAIYNLQTNIVHVKYDQANSVSIDNILKSLQNFTIAAKVYQTLVDASLYDSFLYGINVRSTICKDKLHRKAVNKMSKLLAKMVGESGHSFACSTSFMKSYLPSCYSNHKSMKSVFNLLNVMAKQTNCRSEVINAVKEAGENVALKIAVLRFLKNLNEKEESDVCTYAESVVDCVEEFEQKTLMEFCSYANVSSCDAFKKINLKEICSAQQEL